MWQSSQPVFPYLQCYLAFKTAMFSLESYLDYRQFQKTRESQIPEKAKSLTTQKEFDEARAYQSDRRAFGLFRGTFDFFVDFFMLLYVSPWTWFKVVEYFGEENEIRCSLAWIYLLHVFGFYGIAFSLYSDFVIEQRHGFNKKTIKLFVMDFLKAEAIGVVLGGVFIPALIWIVRWGGEFFYIYVWAFVQAFIFIMMFVYPNWIMPLFNKLETLKDDNLRKKIEDMASTVDFPLTKLYQIDGSTRSSHSNAFMFGFWKNKRIVIFDTLLEQCSHSEILAVLAHELGLTLKQRSNFIFLLQNFRVI